MTIALLKKKSTVEDFFLQSNWKGLVTDALADRWQTEQVKLTFAFTVQDFFSQSNWQGLADQVLTVEPTDLQNDSFCLPFSMSVNDFFQKMEWKGKPDIASMPKKIVSKDSSPVQTELKLEVLSDLF